MDMKDRLIEDFTEQDFQASFRLYFEELGVTVKKWDEMFLKMNNDPHGKDLAYLRTTEAGEVVGFIQFTVLDVDSWFFKTKVGFIREFWIAPAFRNGGHGAALLRLAEDFFAEKQLFASVLTTDTAARFYNKHGYIRIDGIEAENGDPVFAKAL